MDAFEAEEFYDLSLVTDVAVSPSGDRVAFVADEFDRETDDRLSSLFVVPTDGSSDPHRLSRASEASAPTWSPDGAKLAFSATRERDRELAVNRESEDTEDDPADEEEPKPQIWSFDLERGGDARQLTDFEEGARGFDWGPNSERLVVAARDPTDDQREYLDSRRDDGPIVTERLQHKFDGQGWLDDVRTYLFVVDCETRDTERLDDAYVDGGAWEPAVGMAPAWSPEGDRIAFLSNRTERPDDNYVMDVYTVAPDGSDLRKVTDSDLTAAHLRWHPSGERLAFVGKDPDNWYAPEEVYVTAGGESTGYESWSGDLDRPVANAQWGDIAWACGDYEGESGDDNIVGAIGDEGLTRLARFRSSESPKRIFDAQGRDRTIEGFDMRGGTAAVVFSDPKAGKDVFAVDSKFGDSTQLTELNSETLAEKELPQTRRVTFESGDAEIEAVAYLPATFSPDEDDPLPLVASIHGGPVSYDAPTFDFEYSYFTGQGYAVLRVNYRGSSSYGQQFSECIRGEWGSHEPADVLAGVEELVERGWADPERLYATGFSYGGITTGYLVTQTDRFAAAAAEHGVYDFRSAFGTDDSHVWWENDYGVPWENPEAYDESSSITDLGDLSTPLLVTAGGEDWRCPPSQSEQLYVGAKKQDVPARLVVYPAEHHNIGDPDRAVHRLEQIAEWFETY
ncbi:S9 family peptidase [Halorussus halophilus]|uniref:S9 family peptidase n=1 Tax=Halorussus halophilus TaxID=2650975 RepID=UPI0013017E50|nr:S9 family peptidase [Halorussus halophilus]